MCANSKTFTSKINLKKLIIRMLDSYVSYLKHEHRPHNQKRESVAATRTICNTTLLIVQPPN